MYIQTYRYLRTHAQEAKATISGNKLSKYKYFAGCLNFDSVTVFFKTNGKMRSTGMNGKKVLVAAVVIALQIYMYNKHYKADLYCRSACKS